MRLTGPCILAGDVGGTKTILAAFPLDGAAIQPLASTVYPSKDFSNLSMVVDRFLQGRDLDPAGAVFGVAGPAINGRAQVTNLPWLLDEADLSLGLGGIPVRLLNDLEALAWAIPVLPPEHMDTLQQGVPVDRGALAVIAPGTGLGEAFLVWDGAGYRPQPSEGGHADFAPGDDLQEALLAYLRPRFGHVSYERMCSGSGIPNIYAFLKDSGRFPEPPWLSELLVNSVDRTPVIIRSGLEQTSAICRVALELFVSILAAEAGNLVLKVLAAGGVYLGGGLPPRILPLLRAPSFLKAFSSKGRFAGLLERVPVRVITEPQAALLGAAHFGRQAIRT